MELRIGPAMRRALDILSILMHEALIPGKLQRSPEPTAPMEGEDSIASFHSEGAATLLPVYHFNALAISRRVPHGGTVVDLGSGSGRFLAYLATHRPDIHIIGTDLSAGMVRLGTAMLKELGLDDRVELRIADITRFGAGIPAQTALLTSLFSLHHLPEAEDLRRCLRECAAVRQSCGSGLWIFDHARPRHYRTARLFPRIFSPAAPIAFQEDSRNSLIAAYGFEDLRAALEEQAIGPLHSYLARFLPLYQIHWVGMQGGPGRLAPGGWRHGTPLPRTAQRQFDGLRRLFPGISL